MLPCFQRNTYSSNKSNQEQSGKNIHFRFLWFFCPQLLYVFYYFSLSGFNHLLPVPTAPKAASIRILSYINYTLFPIYNIIARLLDEFKVYFSVVSTILSTEHFRKIKNKKSKSYVGTLDINYQTLKFIWEQRLMCSKRWTDHRSQQVSHQRRLHISSGWNWQIWIWLNNQRLYSRSRWSLKLQNPFISAKPFHFIVGGESPVFFSFNKQVAWSPDTFPLALISTCHIIFRVYTSYKENIEKKEKKNISITGKEYGRWKYS